MQKRSETPGDPQTPGGRGVRVRSRLVAGVALVGITVIGAGAPAVLTASGDLTDSQRLVNLAELNRQAVTLAHSLADERDEVTAYIAAGRGAKEGEPSDEGGQGGEPSDKGAEAGVDAARRARVDRQIDEIHAEAPADLRRELAGLPAIRRSALTGKGTAMEAYRAYTDVITRLQALSAELADKTPARAADAGAGTRALAELGRAVDQASATRGLLLGALAVPGKKKAGLVYDPITGQYVEPEDPAGEEADRTRGALSAAAQQARVREQAALADFDQAAPPAARDSLAATVTGPEVKSAETYLARLTDRPELSDGDRKTDQEKLRATLTARIEQMRGVESSLATGEVRRMEQLRDDDVTALELRIALLGGCLLIAIGVSTAVARTLTQPLAVLRIGAARLAESPETEEPVRYTGRNDEFAQVVRSLNTLHGKLLDLGARAERLDAERTDAVAARDALTAELAGVRAELGEQTAELTTELEALRGSVHHTFVNLSLRTLGLVERQLAVIEQLEEREQDPERLATLFKLDHMATVMRRHSENLLVLAGHEHNHAHQGPVPLVDVLRAAVSEIERYERVTIQSLPPHAYVAGFAADDLSHLLAELLENATSFSPPDAKVQFSGWLLESGEVMLSVEDEGIGMTEGRLAELNARLADPETESPSDADRDGEGLGIRVTALLAARHGVRVQLREQKQGGVTAVVVLPSALLPEAPPTALPPSVTVAGTAPTLNLPGSVAEANSNTLPGTRTPRDPLVAAAEATLRATSTTAPEPGVPAQDASAGEAHAGGAPGKDAPAPAAAEHGAAVQDAPAGADPAPGAPEHERPAGEEPVRGDHAGDTAAHAGAETTTPAGTPTVHDASARGAAAHTTPASDGHAQDAPAGHAPEPGAPARDPHAGDAPTQAAPELDAHAEHGPTQDAPVPDAAEHPAPETTLQVRAPREPEAEPQAGPEVEPGPAPGPEAEQGDASDPSPAAEAHERADAQEGDASRVREPKWERVTDKGLPKRTPKVVEPTAPPAGRKGGVDAEALRRRLGGFHQGAKEGRRDAEAEIAESTQQLEAVRTEETGDTVEEARS
ncbi:nitrate- and nitrite sensing domain-containing protein [Streptomyces sp. CB03238]|uniref:nitrate- and nitrite sensing domain-containing protein n=1 Tax=Streptomyces sp. CB03238 TaxID=1907777 RepID=UPI000A10D470|nr:nitrate- and nitrite sensing domain-containing protein [Streptomyces sp. CB03238]ORT61367.1 histidine kinase [Streptomyces sp. CB03238]